MDRPSIYVSYAWKAEKDRQVVDSLEKVFNANGIHLNRDLNLNYKDSINVFKEKLGNLDWVIVVLSKPYLESEYCMSELLEMHRNGEFHKRVFPVLVKGTRIDRPRDRLPFLKYWEDEYSKLERATKGNGLNRIESIQDALNLYSDIRDGIDHLRGILGDMNSTTEDVHAGTNFDALLNKIRAQIGIFADGGSERAGLKQFRQKAHFISGRRF